MNRTEGRRRTTPIGRRSFLRQGSLGVLGAGLAAAGASPPAGADDAPKSRLAWVTHAGATDAQGAGHPEVVRQMVDRAVRELTGKDALGEAWRAFVSPDDVVGIKVTTAGGATLSTQPCVVQAIVAGLVAAGVKENNIIIWERFSRELPKCGYTLNDSDEGVRCYGTDKGLYDPSQKREADAWRELLKPYYTSEATPVADREAQFSRILTDEITALINVPVMKDHLMAGMTCAMKNHYGSILTPAILHPNYCDPYIAELNATEPIRGKTRLVVVDGLRSVYRGGPRATAKWLWRPNGILASTDPVAVDATALRLLEAKRQEVGMDPIGDRARHVATAARIGLGTNDPGRIEVREVELEAPA